MLVERPIVLRACRPSLVLLAFFICPEPGQGGVGVTSLEDIGEVCSRKFIVDDNRLRSACDFFHEGEIKGRIADDILSAALVFPHRLDDGVFTADLSSLSPDLCEVGAEGLEGKAVTEFLLKLGKLDPSQRPDVLKFSYLRVNGRFNVPSVPITHKLLFDHVVFCGPVVFADAVMTGELQFTRSIFVAGPGEVSEGLLRADGLSSTAGILIQESRVGGIILRGARAPLIGITESAFGHVGASRVEAKRLALHNSRQYESVFNRTQEWLERLYNCDRGQYEEIIGTYPLKFFASNIDLVDLVLEGLFYSDRLVVDGALTAAGAKISTVRLRAAVLPAVDFRQLSADRVELFGATLGNSSKRTGCEIDRAFRYDVDFVSFQGAEIEGDFLLHPQPPGEEPADVPQPAVTRGLTCLNELRVGGDLDLSAVIAEQIDLRRTAVAGTLSLASETYENGRIFTLSFFLRHAWYGDRGGLDVRCTGLTLSAEDGSEQRRWVCVQRRLGCESWRRRFT